MRSPAKMGRSIKNAQALTGARTRIQGFGHLSADGDEISDILDEEARIVQLERENRRLAERVRVSHTAVLR